MIKMYRCPCNAESHTEEEFNNLKENENCHKYCKIWDCYEYPSDFEVFWIKKREDEIKELLHLAKKYGYRVTKVTPEIPK